MKRLGIDNLRKAGIVISGAVVSFRKNNGLTSASSLAFSATLALIPALFLLTSLLGAAIGSSVKALLRTQDLLTQMIPAYSQDILREVRFITNHSGTIGVVNSLLLLWTITPLVADLRMVLGTIFRKKPSRPFLLEKLFDVAITIIFLIGIAVITIAGIFLSLMEKTSLLHLLPGYLVGVVPFFFVSVVVFSLYFVFSPRMKTVDLIIGALVTAGLWFAMRPAFHLFLTYNPGYGFTFGSFKSLFVVIIWIYVSLAVFLFGAEIAASIGRLETVFIKRLIAGKGGVPASVAEHYSMRYEKGDVIFTEGDEGREMYFITAGSVAIHKNGREIAMIPQGKRFGEMAFLLSEPRIATAVAREDVELVVINSENINNLMTEFPEFVFETLRNMAFRLREADKMIN